MNAIEANGSIEKSRPRFPHLFDHSSSISSNHTKYSTADVNDRSYFDSIKETIDVNFTPSRSIDTCQMTPKSGIKVAMDELENPFSATTKIRKLRLVDRYVGGLRDSNSKMSRYLRDTPPKHLRTPNRYATAARRTLRAQPLAIFHERLLEVRTPDDLEMIASVASSMRKQAPPAKVHLESNSLDSDIVKAYQMIGKVELPRKLQRMTNIGVCE